MNARVQKNIWILVDITTLVMYGEVETRLGLRLLLLLTKLSFKCDQHSPDQLTKTISNKLDASKLPLDSTDYWPNTITNEATPKSRNRTHLHPSQTKALVMDRDNSLNQNCPTMDSRRPKKRGRPKKTWRRTEGKGLDMGPSGACLSWSTPWRAWLQWKDSVAHDLHTIAPGPLECACWRQFVAQWGDCKKSWIAPYYYYYY